MKGAVLAALLFCIGHLPLQASEHEVQEHANHTDHEDGMTRPTGTIVSIPGQLNAEMIHREDGASSPESIDRVGVIRTCLYVRRLIDQQAGNQTESVCIKDPEALNCYPGARLVLAFSVFAV